jgi:hypothetical protein
MPFFGVLLDTVIIGSIGFTMFSVGTTVVRYIKNNFKLPEITRPAIVHRAYDIFMRKMSDVYLLDKLLFEAVEETKRMDQRDRFILKPFTRTPRKYVKLDDIGTAKLTFQEKECVDVNPIITVINRMVKNYNTSVQNIVSMLKYDDDVCFVTTYHATTSYVFIFVVNNENTEVTNIYINADLAVIKNGVISNIFNVKKCDGKENDKEKEVVRTLPIKQLPYRLPRYSDVCTEDD